MEVEWELGQRLRIPGQVLNQGQRVTLTCALVSGSASTGSLAPTNA